MVYLEKCISLVFLSSYFENAWSKLKKKTSKYFRITKPKAGITVLQHLTYCTYRHTL
jgi:hypothetical protein